MLQFDRITLGRQAKELGVVRDTYEKVCRLTDILAFIAGDDLLSNSLALKGGTAINLTLFDLPRLSVDIDLDYALNTDREEMLAHREIIAGHIRKYMQANGYALSPKSKQYHALDSFVYEYSNSGGVKDNIKVEINYMLRAHVLPPAPRGINFAYSRNVTEVLCVDPLETIAAKTMALLNRAAPRDLYDMANVFHHNIIAEEQYDLYRKCVVFYGAISADSVPDHFTFENIDRITMQKVKTALIPVLRRASHFNLPAMQAYVKEQLAERLQPTASELNFWKLFSEGEYRPDELFDDQDIISRVRNHPMALWKCSCK